MKVRTGFVSNSSTSSFCVIGFMIKDKSLENVMKKEGFEECYELGEQLGEKNMVAWSGSDYGVKDGHTIVGRLLMDISDDGDECESKEFDLDKISKELEDIKKRFNIADSVKPKIYTGTRCS